MYSMDSEITDWCDGRIKCPRGHIAVGCDSRENYKNLKCQKDDDWWGGVKARRSKRKSRKNKKSRRR